MKRKHFSRTAAVGAACAAVFAAAVVLCLLQSSVPGGTVRIVSGGRVVETIDLDASPDQTFTVESESGSNTVTVENHRIRVSEADCPDQTCVKTGFLGGGRPIVCLPHRLVIEYAEGSEEADFAAG